MNKNKWKCKKGSRPFFRAGVAAGCVMLALCFTQGAAAIDYVPDYYTLVFPTLWPKSGTPIIQPPEHRHALIEADYNGPFEQWYTDRSLLRSNPNNGVTTHGDRMETKTFGYVYMPWPKDLVVQTNLTFVGSVGEVSAYVMPAPRGYLAMSMTEYPDFREPWRTDQVPLPRGRSEVHNEDGLYRFGQRYMVEENADENGPLVAQLVKPLVDGWWTPGEAFCDTNANSIFDRGTNIIYPCEDWWDCDNATVRALTNVYGGLTLSMGDLSFVDDYTFYMNGSPGVNEHTSPFTAVYEPDGIGVSLGNGGRIDLEFFNNYLTNEVGSDLAIFGSIFATNSETVNVSVSPDGLAWTLVTPVPVAVSATTPTLIDIAPAALGRYAFVKITDSGANDYAAEAPGADIDTAVAISSTSFLSWPGTPDIRNYQGVFGGINPAPDLNGEIYADYDGKTIVQTNGAIYRVDFDTFVSIPVAGFYEGLWGGEIKTNRCSGSNIWLTVPEFDLSLKNNLTIVGTNVLPFENFWDCHNSNSPLPGTAIFGVNGRAGLPPDIRGELYADYSVVNGSGFKTQTNGDQVIAVGFDTSVVVWVADPVSSTNMAITLSEFDMTPNDGIASNHGDLAHDLWVCMEPPAGTPPTITPNHIPKNGLFDFQYDQFSFMPSVRRAFIGTTNVPVSVLVSQWRQANGSPIAPNGNYSNATLVDVNVPVYQSIELYGAILVSNASFEAYSSTNANWRPARTNLVFDFTPGQPSYEGDFDHMHRIDPSIVELAEREHWSLVFDNILTNRVFDYQWDPVNEVPLVFRSADVAPDPSQPWIQVTQALSIVYYQWQKDGQAVPSDASTLDANLVRVEVPVYQSVELFGKLRQDFGVYNEYSDWEVNTDYVANGIILADTYFVLTNEPPDRPGEWTYMGVASNTIIPRAAGITNADDIILYSNSVAWFDFRTRIEGMWDSGLDVTSNDHFVFIMAEPFEDFLSWWDPYGGVYGLGAYTYRSDLVSAHRADRDPRAEPLPTGQDITNIAYNAYIMWNYPADPFWAIRADPLATDPDWARRALIARAGNGRYDGPDDWWERGNCKYRQGGNLLFEHTVEPGTAMGVSQWIQEPRGNFLGGNWSNWWFQAFGSVAPAWNADIPNVRVFDPVDVLTVGDVFDTEQIIGIGGAVQVTFSGTLTAPVATGSVSVAAGVETFDDNGNGQLVGSGGGAGSINYQTGAITITCVSPPAVAQAIMAYYQYTVTSVGAPWIPPLDSSWSYDSRREFHDMPSSLYHSPWSPVLCPQETDLWNGLHYGGDERLGEITSPLHHDIFGHDFANYPGNANGPDYNYPPGGPLAYNCPGEYGWDAGNVLNLECLTRRYEPGLPIPGNTGQYSRDCNLDGMIDQGQTRNGYENYRMDTDPTMPDSGDTTDTLYPYNRHRMAEDFIEAWDYGQDWTDFVKRSGPQAGDPIPVYMQCVSMIGGSGRSAGGNTDAWTCDTGAYMMCGAGRSVGQPDCVFATETPGGEGAEGGVLPSGGGFFDVVIHEQGHDWFALPDLYDYDIRRGGYGLFNMPMVGFDLMAGGDGHCGDMYLLRTMNNRAEYGTNTHDWMIPQNLTNILVKGGGPTTIEMYPVEEFQDNYFRWIRPDTGNEIFWFAYSYNGFGTALGEGVQVTHTDYGAFDGNDAPEQVRHEGHFTWEVVPADGEWYAQDGVGGADAGDAFPGPTHKYTFTADTEPAARWWDTTDIGLRILDIELPGKPGYPAFVTFEWYDITNVWAWPPTGHDLDEDGIPDAWEYHYFDSLDTADDTTDSDKDGLSDPMEYLAKSNPLDRYSLDPSRDDPYRTNAVLDGLVDIDSDGLSNAKEQQLGMNPIQVDSDDDGFDDGDEVNSTVLCYDQWVSDGAYSRSPLIQRSMVLDGSAVNVPPGVSGASHDRFELASWTVECWLRPTGGTGTIVERVTLGGLTNFSLRLVGGVPKVAFTTVAGILYTAGGNVSIPMNEWTHLAGVFDPANDMLALYVNGVSLQAQVTVESCATGEQRSPPEGVRGLASELFTGVTTIGSGLTGNIDDLRVWGVARTREEIAGNMRQFGAGVMDPDPPEAPPVDPGTPGADAVLSYTDGGPTNLFPNPMSAVGASDGTAVSLGSNGSITVMFTDNLLAAGDGNDLVIYTLNATESVDVEISSNGSAWIAVGTTVGPAGGVDIDSFVTPEQTFAYVRLTDPWPANTYTNTAPGADIDAVEAVSAPAPAPPVAEDSGLVAYYPFDDGGTNAEDYVHMLNMDYLRNGQYALIDVTLDSSEYADLLGELDFDNDGIADWWEKIFFDGDADPEADPDGDGLNNLYEYYTCSNPKKSDTDNDGLPDEIEDLDADGLVNMDEQSLGSDPRLPDTDDDGVPDGVEKQWASVLGTDPADALKPTGGFALSFGGTTNDYVEMPLELRFALTNWSLEARIRTAASWAAAPATIRWQVGPGVTNVISGSVIAERRVTSVSGRKDNYVLAVDTYGRPVAGFGDVWVTGSTPLPNDGKTWSSLAATYDYPSGTLNLYVDGVLRQSTARSERPITSGIGPCIQRIGEGFNGEIYEVRIWGRTLTASNVVEYLGRSLDGDEAGLVAYYRCDEGTSYEPAVAGGTYGGVFFPAGALSFADGVVGYFDGGPGNTFTNFALALGVPDGAPNYVSLGSNGWITLQFSNNVLVADGGPGNDLYIFESIPLAETVTVEISETGATWTNVGIAYGTTAFGIDIDPFVPAPAKGTQRSYQYVRLTDGGTNTYVAPRPGADIDAVGATTPVGDVHGTSDVNGWDHGQVEDFAAGVSRDWTNKWFRSATIQGNVRFVRRTVGVVSVSSTTPDGAYYPGDQIDVTVTFSEPVTVGTPVIQLETGDTDQYAFYSSGNGTSNIHFNYIIQPEDWNLDLDYLSQSSLLPNGVPIKDLNGNNVDLTMPVPGSVGSLSWNKDIFVDPPGPIHGMGRAWLMENFGTQYGIDPDGDPDSDGLSNLGEFRAGTGPNDSRSTLQVESVVSEPDGVLVEWQAVVGMSYTVEYTDKLGTPWISPPEWQGIVATSELMAVIDDGSLTGGLSPVRFYRVKTP